MWPNGHNRSQEWHMCNRCHPRHQNDFFYIYIFQTILFFSFVLFYIIFRFGSPAGYMWWMYVMIYVTPSNDVCDINADIYGWYFALTNNNNYNNNNNNNNIYIYLQYGFHGPIRHYWHYITHGCVSAVKRIWFLAISITHNMRLGSMLLPGFVLSVSKALTYWSLGDAVVLSN